MITELSEPGRVAAAAIGRGFKLLRDLPDWPVAPSEAYQVWAVDDDQGAVVTVSYNVPADGPITVKQVVWSKPDNPLRGQHYRSPYTLNRTPLLMNRGGLQRPDRPLEALLRVFDRERALPEVGDLVRVDPDRATYNRGQLAEVVGIEGPECCTTVRVRFTTGRDEGWVASMAPSDLIAPGEDQ